MPGCYRFATAPPQPLIQLRRQFTASCSDYRLSVETGEAGWTASVRDSESGPALYLARRSSLNAAKIAATEFAAFRMGEWRSPEAIAGQLPWKESW